MQGVAGEQWTLSEDLICSFQRICDMCVWVFVSCLQLKIVRVATDDMCDAMKRACWAGIRRC